MKIYIAMTWASIVCLFLTAALHSISLFVAHEGTNEIEKQFVETMTQYQMDMGAGYHRTFQQIFISLSACFSLLCLFGSMLLWYLLKHQTQKTVMTGILNIYLLIYGILVVLMWVFTFLPPIICTSLSLVFLIGTRWSLGKLQ